MFGLVAALFVIAGLYVRRRYDGRALALLWAVSTMVMAVTSSAGFLLLIDRLGKPASPPGRMLAFAFMLIVYGGSLGGASIAVHKAQSSDGPWLTGAGILWGIVGFVAGGAIAVGVVMAAIVLLGATMAR